MKSVTNEPVPREDFSVLLEKYVIAVLNQQKPLPTHQASRLLKLTQRRREN